MNPLLAEALLAACAALVAGVLALWQLGTPAALWTVIAVLMLFFARQLWQMKRLLAWAASPLGTAPPEASWAWDDVFLALGRRGRLATQEREQAAAALDRFRHAAEALPDGVVILDSKRSIEWMNLHAEACLGLKSSTDTGSRISNLLREPEFLDYLDQAGQSGAPLELRTQRNPGRTLLVQLARFAADRSLLLVRDVTQLQKLATMRRDFVANVSHELKTPLTVTLGFVETAIDALPDATHEEITHYLTTAAEQGRRMQHLIEDLLTLSSLETDAPPPLEEPLPLAALLADVRQEAQSLSKGAHTVMLENTGPAALLGSTREIRSAFGNLATNAVRYSPPGAAIVLRWAREKDGGAAFSVIDTGIGIAAEHLPRLTERFYRVDRGRSRDAGGTGLGLAIVKHVLERHQATLRISSEVGQGSCFCASFPSHRIPAG